MKLRDKFLYMSFGAGLVVLGMVLNSFLVDDADAQGDSLGDMRFRDITCRDITIVDGNGKWRGTFGLGSSGDALLKIYGDDGNSYVTYLGPNVAENDEMMFQLKSKSKTDKRKASMMIDPNGGLFQSRNKMGESVVRIGVGDKGGGTLDLRDKHGYKY